MTRPTEELWKGEFGDQYTKRNTGMVPANIILFANILATTGDIQSVIEFGCGTGQNLVAIRRLLPEAILFGVEINKQAAEECKVAVVENRAILDPGLDITCDLAFTKGVLIHQPPEDLPKVYSALYKASRKYILVAEYYSPIPVEVPYRGHTEVMWKRDFAGEMLDLYDDLRLIDYGFAYHRANYPQDDITWFLMEKQ